MAHRADESLPVWSPSGEQTMSFETLTGDLRTETCVVGAGMAGLSVAWHLARAGQRVTVVESGPGPGLGETGRSTAHLASAVDDGFVVLEHLFGPAGARAVAESHAAAIDWIERQITDGGIECGFRRLDGWLFNPPTGGIDLGAEAAAASRAGLSATLEARAPLAGFQTGLAIRFGAQARMDPRAFIHGLAAACARLGVRLLGNAPVVSVEGGHPARVSTGQGWHVLADAVVVATDSPINDRIAIHSKLVPMRTYAVALEAAAEGADPDALYWDSADPYHYVRFGEAGDGARVLIVGGEDHRVGQPAHGQERWQRLEEWARQRFAGLGAVKARWSGQIIEPVDRIAFIGRNPGESNVFVATGDSGNGITHGAIAGLVISDLVLGRDNAWARLYDPARLTLKAAQGYADAGLKVAEHYAEWLTGGEVDDVALIPPGGGAVVRQGLSKLAVYRDESGQLHKRLAACSHMKCVVAWNDAERSWDCPCHGSRFDRFGRVLNGPATSPLAPEG
ncbi:MAG TPA: FAD-dependent oxidoreductase [Magnetospirillum sp.]|jgi:glycine/D-amino acid oxidase-like deaminating enzyme/nitrite reductase/ring-hydroxylating ferredoxin subunit|nr:FAD-dependent oxidoreductase [Magnetospirillum sp.]